MRGTTVLEEEETLPGPESGCALHDGDDLARTREGHPNVGGHVVGAFVGMSKPRSILGDKAVKEFFQIIPCFRICILHDDEARTGMLNKDGDITTLDPRRRDESMDLTRKLIGSLAMGRDLENLLANVHENKVVKNLKT